MIQFSELIDRDIDDDSVSDQVILFIRKQLTVRLHIVKSDSKFPCNGICSLFPATGLTVKIVALFTEHFVMIFNQDAGTHTKLLMKQFVSAATDGADDL